MWVEREETAAQPFAVSPSLVAVLAISVGGTVLLGLYPGPVFELAAASAASLGRAAFSGIP
jgi:hypothetical protein